MFVTREKSRENTRDFAAASPSWNARRDRHGAANPGKFQQGTTTPVLRQRPKSVIHSRNAVILNVVKDLLFSNLSVQRIAGNMLRTSGS